VRKPKVSTEGVTHEITAQGPN